MMMSILRAALAATLSVAALAPSLARADWSPLEKHGDFPFPYGQIDQFFPEDLAFHGITWREFDGQMYTWETGTDDAPVDLWSFMFIESIEPTFVFSQDLYAVGLSVMDNYGYSIFEVPVTLTCYGADGALVAGPHTVEIDDGYWGGGLGQTARFLGLTSDVPFRKVVLEAHEIELMVGDNMLYATTP